MSELYSVSYDRPANEPLNVEWIDHPDQVSVETARDAMRTEAAAYASSPGICGVIDPSYIWSHLVPMSPAAETLVTTVDPIAIAKRRAQMQNKIAMRGVVYGVASNADQPTRMTGLIELNPLDPSLLQTLRRRIGIPSPDLYVSKLIETPDADGAGIGLLHAAASHNGYNPKRAFTIDVLNRDSEQRRLVMRRLELQGLTVGQARHLGGTILHATQFSGQSIGWVGGRLERGNPWLKTGAADTIDTER